MIRQRPWMLAALFAWSSLVHGAPKEPLRLRLELGASALDPRAVEAEIERELEHPVVVVSDDTANLELEVLGPGRLVLEYYGAPPGKIERSIDLPADPRRASEVIALLVGNVVRDEAAELLRSLHEDKPAAPEEPAPPSEPALSPQAEPEPERPREEPAQPAQPPPAAVPAEEPRAEPEGELINGPLKLNASLFFPIAVQTDSNRRVLNLELGLFYSNLGAVRGVAGNFGLVVVQRGVRGASIASWNHIYGPSSGVALGLLFNGSFGPFRGALLSSGVNLAESQRGVAAAAGANIVLEGSQGALIAPINVANTARGALIGQINVAKNVRGVSVGIINVADRVDGVQVGIINVAREVHGASVGLASVAGNGSVQPTYWFSTSGASHHVGVKFVAGCVYSELAWGVSPSEKTQAFEAGGGPHFQLLSRFYLEPGIYYANLHALNSLNDDRPADEVHYRLRLGVRLFNAFDLFAAGGAVQRLNGSQLETVRGEALFGAAAL